VTPPRAVTIDTSVWIPFLRTREYARTVDPLIAAGRAWVHSVALLELYAGTANPADARAVDAIRLAAESLGRFYHPGVEDLILAGRVLSYWSRLRGRVRPRDHSHDLLIAIGAARTGGTLLTANARDMRRWATVIARRSGLRLSVIAARQVPTEGFRFSLGIEASSEASRLSESCPRSRPSAHRGVTG